jgi:hypothetical protein
VVDNTPRFFTLKSISAESGPVLWRARSCQLVRFEQLVDYISAVNSLINVSRLEAADSQFSGSYDTGESSSADQLLARNIHSRHFSCRSLLNVELILCQADALAPSGS